MPSLTCTTSEPIDLTALQIEAERLILRSLEARDGPDIFNEFTSEITRLMYPKPAETPEETLAFIARSRENMAFGKDVVLAITDKKTGEFLGVCGFHGKDAPTTPELGIWLKKAAHGNKYGREAVMTLSSWAVDHIDFAYAIYPVDRANVASRKIPEALGGEITEEKTVKMMSGGYLDEVVYKIPYEMLKECSRKKV